MPIYITIDIDNSSYRHRNIICHVVMHLRFSTMGGLAAVILALYLQD